MILGMKPLPIGIQILSNEGARFTFHLTGSRFFGGETDHSDWDFITERTQEVTAFLLESGFVTMNLSMRSLAMRHPSGVDVILVNPICMNRMLRLHKILAKWPEFATLPKGFRRGIFDLAHHLGDAR